MNAITDNPATRSMSSERGKTMYYIKHVAWMNIPHNNIASARKHTVNVYGRSLGIRIVKQVFTKSIKEYKERELLKLLKG